MKQTKSRLTVRNWYTVSIFASITLALIFIANLLSFPLANAQTNGYPVGTLERVLNGHNSLNESEEGFGDEYTSQSVASSYLHDSGDVQNGRDTATTYKVEQLEQSNATFAMQLTPVPSVSGISISSDSGSDGTYAAGDVIEVAVTFDSEVTVDTTNGTPYLSITIGGETRTASYSSTASTNSILAFTYTVVANDDDQDGIAIDANSLSLNGGTIKADGSDTDALLDHTALPVQGGHLVNKIPKIITDGIAITSTPKAAEDTYGLGETIKISVPFDSVVVVSGTDVILTFIARFGDANHTNQSKAFSYVGGSGTNTLNFERVVIAVDVDSDGIYVPKYHLNLQGGTLTHATTGRNADLSYGLPGLMGAFPEHKVDGSLLPPPSFGLCGARVGTGSGFVLDAELDLCWETGAEIPARNDVVIEYRYRIFWYDGDPFPEWREAGRGNDFAACSQGRSDCIRFTHRGLMRGSPATYEMRIREGDTVLSNSGQLDAQAPNENDAILNAELYGCYIIGGFEPCGSAARGAFWMELVFTDPEVEALSVETVIGLEPSDFEITNGGVLAVQPWDGAVYKVIVLPGSLGQPVTISLPANRVEGVGEDFSADGGNNYTRVNTASNVVTQPTAERE